MPEQKSKSFWPRKRSRLIVIKALFPEVVGSTEEGGGQRALERAKSESGWRRCDREFAELLIERYFSERKSLERLVFPFLSRPLSSIPPMVKLLMFLGTLELLEKTSPLGVVISEYGFIANRYTSEETRGFLQAIFNLVGEELESQKQRSG